MQSDIEKIKSVYPEDSEFFRVTVELLRRKNKGIYKSLEKQLRKWLSDDNSKFKYPFTTNQMIFLIT